MTYDYMQTQRPIDIGKEWEFVTLIQCDSWKEIWIFRKEHIQKSYIS